MNKVVLINIMLVSNCLFGSGGENPQKSDQIVKNLIVWDQQSENGGQIGSISIAEFLQSPREQNGSKVKKWKMPKTKENQRYLKRIQSYRTDERNNEELFNASSRSNNLEGNHKSVSDQ